ncbi:hypothetical protein Pelo_14219 [Pelomyxa schiedti]|nr:hypothetical protein Pelo_14219 [Pelomyxa schiedti]
MQTPGKTQVIDIEEMKTLAHEEMRQTFLVAQEAESKEEALRILHSKIDELRNNLEQEVRAAYAAKRDEYIKAFVDQISSGANPP